MPWKYETWPGSNRFLPCGCIMGPLSDICANMCVYCCILAALIPYCIFMLPKIWQLSPAIPIIFLVSVGATILFLNLTQCTDPGIIPRRPYLTKNSQNFKKYLEPSNSVPAKTKLCSTCKVYRPSRAFHCSICGNCVLVFDHHCSFVNNCIGMRNYRFFVSFLGSMMITIILFFVNVVVFGMRNNSKSISKEAVIVICSLVGVFIGLPLLGFFGFHLYLVCKGKTTRELLKDLNISHQEEDQNQQNQWCFVDPPFVNLFENISEDERQKLYEQLQNLQHFDPLVIQNSHQQNDRNNNDPERLGQMALHPQIRQQKQKLKNQSSGMQESKRSNHEFIKN